MSMMNRREVLLLAVGSTSTVSGCLSTSEGTSTPADSDRQQPERGEVIIELIDEPAFRPERIEISVEQTVTWKSSTRDLQTVTASRDDIPEGAEYFSSGDIPGETLATILYPVHGGIRYDETFSHTFTDPGEYHYYSIPSKMDGMEGSIVVTQE